MNHQTLENLVDENSDLNTTRLLFITIWNVNKTN
jgi:hypothetical protein